MATITDVVAMRVVFDLIKDSTVVDATPYSSVDQLEAATMLKYAEPLYTNYPQFWPLDAQDPPQPIDWASATNDQKADVVRQVFRQFLRDQYVTFSRRAARDSADTTAAATANTEVDTDLGA